MKTKSKRNESLQDQTQGYNYASNWPRLRSPGYCCKLVLIITILLSVLCTCYELMPPAPATASAAPQEAHVPAKSVWDGVYTEAQAGRGETLYRRECLKCHERSEFTGSHFISIWGGRTAYDLFENLRTTMPLDGPGRLGRQGYVDVIAYIFRRNEFPTGELELASNTETLKQIRIEPRPPQK